MGFVHLHISPLVHLASATYQQNPPLHSAHAKRIKHRPFGPFCAIVVGVCRSSLSPNTRRWMRFWPRCGTTSRLWRRTSRNVHPLGPSMGCWVRLVAGRCRVRRHTLKISKSEVLCFLFFCVNPVATAASGKLYTHIYIYIHEHQEDVTGFLGVFEDSGVRSVRINDADPDRFRMVLFHGQESKAKITGDTDQAVNALNGRIASWLKL